VTKTTATIPEVPIRRARQDPDRPPDPARGDKQGVEMVVLCGRKPTTIDHTQEAGSPGKMFAEKYEAKSKSYLQEVRQSAMIEYR